jgi:ABC-type dipeptide/oligopeptide/nickel transport system ATPase component
VPRTACPFCFEKIDSSRLAYQCSGRGNKQCEKEPDEVWRELTGATRLTYHTFVPQPGKQPTCDKCGALAKRRACPTCHTALPIDFVDSKSPMIGLAGSKGSGKTVLMTVLIKHLREVVGRRYGADIRIATDNPDGHQGLSDYQANRETPLYTERTLPTGTSQLGSSGRERAMPVVLRWRQESSGRFGNSVKSTMLSFVDSAGEDLNDVETTFTLKYLSSCDSLIIALDPFALPGARARLSLPEAATQVADDTPLAVIDHISEMLKTEHGVKKKKRIGVPVAIVFTKIDAFYPTLDTQNPVMASTPEVPAYDNTDGQAVHEHMMALLDEWGADDIDRFMRLTYSDYRYFAVSALGAEPDYGLGQVAAGGVRPHRVEDPVLWLLSKGGTVPAK